MLFKRQKVTRNARAQALCKKLEKKLSHDSEFDRQTDLVVSISEIDKIWFSDQSV